MNLDYFDSDFKYICNYLNFNTRREAFYHFISFNVVNICFFSSTFDNTKRMVYAINNIDMDIVGKTVYNLLEVLQKAVYG